MTILKFGSFYKNNLFLFLTPKYNPIKIYRIIEKQLLKKYPDGNSGNKYKNILNNITFSKFELEVMKFFMMNM